MDKTAWIVVSLCVGMLGFNFWYQKDQQEKNPPAVVAPADAAATPTTSPATATTPAATTPASAVTPAVQAKQGVASKEIARLTSKNSAGQPVVSYGGKVKGGSVQYVEMLDKAINSTDEDLQGNVRINGNSTQGIGTLMFSLSPYDAPQYDDAIYEVKEQTADKVVLQGKVGDIVVRKTYSLVPIAAAKEGEEVLEGRAYMLQLDMAVLNASAQNLSANNWGIYAGMSAPISSAEGPQYTYYVTQEDGAFTKESVGSFNPWFSSAKARVFEKNHNKLSWAGSMNQYYATVLKPGAQSGMDGIYAAPSKVTMPKTGKQSDALELGVLMPDFTLPAATADMPAVPRTFSYTLFAGPKLNMMLEKLNADYEKIDNIMDYGWLSLLSYPMNWLINVFYSWFGNWGWAIVAMTFVVRLLIWPLYRKSYMSMKRMSLLQPQMKELKEKHPDDPQKVNMEMMKLYKKYGISPLGGCLPMFLQIPIFFAFFYVLQTAAEFRGASFLGWVTDLSQMDTVASFDVMGYHIPLNILPIIMGISMYVQMRMTPQAGDPTQQKIMKFMPLMFFFFCYTYPSALALYWTTQNIISIGQTLLIQRMAMPVLEVVTPKKGAKKGFFERMMEQQQAALAEQQKKSQQMRNVTKKK